MKKFTISESKKRRYTSATGNRYRTRMTVTHIEKGKKVNGKPAYISLTEHEPIFNES